MNAIIRLTVDKGNNGLLICWLFIDSLFVHPEDTSKKLILVCQVANPFYAVGVIRNDYASELLRTTKRMNT